ncbi:MAG: 50S ribosomal protein L29 [Candidatus Berkelbacteria bacterium]|nr:50S ribosomal protein L29 [Candidatus Berkelbacteria bacterium]
MKSTEEIKKFRDMDIEHLIKELAMLELTHEANRLKVAAGKLGNHAQLEVERQNIARIKTIINEKGEE